MKSKCHRFLYVKKMLPFIYIFLLSQVQPMDINEHLWGPCPVQNQSFLETAKNKKILKTFSRLACVSLHSKYNWSNLICYEKDTKKCSLYSLTSSPLASGEDADPNCRIKMKRCQNRQTTSMMIPFVDSCTRDSTKDNTVATRTSQTSEISTIIQTTEIPGTTTVQNTRNLATDQTTTTTNDETSEIPTTTYQTTTTDTETVNDETSEVHTTTAPTTGISATTVKTIETTTKDETTKMSTTTIQTTEDCRSPSNQIQNWNYEKIQGGCIHISDLRSNQWNYVKKGCEMYDGNLWTDSSNISFQNFRNYVKGKNISMAWVGIRKHEGHFQWLNGVQVISKGHKKYENWHQNEPSEKECGIISKKHHYKIAVTDCSNDEEEVSYLHVRQIFNANKLRLWKSWPASVCVNNGQP